MRGSLKQRSAGSWTLILDLGYVLDPATGKRKRKQQWITVRGSKRDAQTRLNTLLSEASAGTLVAPSKRTVGEWLREWVDKAIKPPMRTQRAYDTYCSVIALHLIPSLGAIKVQALKAIDLERYYAVKTEAGQAPATLAKHHHVMHGALEAAVRAQLVARNVAKLVTGKPHRPEGHAAAIEHCWTADEAASFLQAAKAAGPRPAAFYAVALDAGMRKSELCGLLWRDVDLTEGRIRVNQQLLKGGPAPTFSPVKGKKARTVDISPETVDLLRAHKAQQGTIKLSNGPRYHDHGLVFCKDWSEQRRGDTLGDPLPANNIGQREYARILKAAGVRPIKFHGLRHTCATLLISAGVPSKVVQERLGHRQIGTTLDTYAHVLPSMQREAARQLAALLHRK